MTPRQRKLFLASHAGMWCWRASDGVYVVRAIHEGKQRFRRYSTFLFQRYPWDEKRGRYRRPKTLIERRCVADTEADLLLSELVDQPLELVCRKLKLPAPEPGELPPPIYTHQGKGLAWFFAREDGLCLARMVHDQSHRTYFGSSVQVSFRPYDQRHRWVTLASERFDKKSEAESHFAIAVAGIDEFLMALSL